MRRRICKYALTKNRIKELRVSNLIHRSIIRETQKNDGFTSISGRKLDIGRKKVDGKRARPYNAFRLTDWKHAEGNFNNSDINTVTFIIEVRVFYAEPLVSNIYPRCSWIDRGLEAHVHLREFSLSPHLFGIV